MTIPFRVADAVFIESAYLSGEAKMSVSTRDTTQGRALGTSTVQAILGMPGGMFVQHKNVWNFLPWANVKSARLIDVPAEVLEMAGAQVVAAEAPGAYLKPQAAAVSAPAVTPEPPVRRGPGRPRKVQPEAVAPDANDDLLGGTPQPPAALPARDAMGVLLSLQPTDGPKLACGACGGVYVQGANHVCTKPQD